MIYNFEDLSFRLLTVDRYFHTKGYFNVKARPFAAISFRISGTGAFVIANKHLLSKPGDILFVPANTPYKVEYSCGESIVVHLDNCNYFEAENTSLQNATSIEVRFQRLLNIWNERRSVNKVKSIIYDIFERITEDKKISMENTSLATCIRYMEQHFNDPELTVEKVCAVGFISVSGLQRAFNMYFGTSPKQYLIKFRMSKAIELLSESSLSIKDIAMVCGFTDEKYFSRAFKKIYGYPPSQLRNHMNV